MRLERTDLAVGIAACGALIVAVGVIIWLARGGREETYTLYTQFAEISGVAPQSPVFLRGYEIGRVAGIEPVMAATGPLFIVHMDIRWQLAGSTRATLPQGTTALLKPPPIIGSATIELAVPDEAGLPPLAQGDTIPGIVEPTLPQQASTLGNQVAFEAYETMASAREMMDSLTLATAAAHALLQRTGAGVPQILERIATQLDATAALTNELKGQLGALTPSIAATVDSANALVADSRALVQRLNSTVGETQPDLRAILANLERTSLVLEHFTRQVAQQPTRLLTGVKLPSTDSLRAAARADSTPPPH